MSNDLAEILEAMNRGDPQAANDLLPLVYDELRKLACQRMAKESSPQTLQPTALVHEAFVRLVGKDVDLKWDSRGHFFGAAAEAMRRILIDNARRKKTVKHGGGWNRNELLENDAVLGSTADSELLELNAALTKLEVEDSQLAELVKLRFFTGLTIEEIAKISGVSARTVKRNWAYARAWLRSAMEGIES